MSGQALAISSYLSDWLHIGWIEDDGVTSDFIHCDHALGVPVGPCGFAYGRVWRPGETIRREFGASELPRAVRGVEFNALVLAAALDGCMPMPAVTAQAHVAVTDEGCIHLPEPPCDGRQEPGTVRVEVIEVGPKGSGSARITNCGRTPVRVGSVETWGGSVCFLNADQKETTPCNYPKAVIDTKLLTGGYDLGPTDVHFTTFSLPEAWLLSTNGPDDPERVVVDLGLPVFERDDVIGWGVLRETLAGAAADGA